MVKMKSKRELVVILNALEVQLAEQLTDILQSKTGFGGVESYNFDRLLSQRHALRFVLGMEYKAFHFQADWERWIPVQGNEPTAATVTEPAESVRD